MTPATVELNPNSATGSTSAPLGLLPAATNPGQRPPLFAARDEVFFWTREWQAGERESAAEREAGNMRTFGNADDLLAWLRAPEE